MKIKLTQEQAIHYIGKVEYKDAFEYEAMKMSIEALQTDLVRCGECVYWDEGKCWNLKGLNKTDGAVDADDFCSYGERSE